VGKEDWPNRGEVDILEGVNDQGPNASTLHTSTNCTMPAVRNQTGYEAPLTEQVKRFAPNHFPSRTSGQLDCDVAVNWNTGCGVKFSKPNSYGPDFNKNGGGWLAVERNNQFIKTWFWPRDSQDVPRDVRRFGPRVNPDNWVRTALFWARGAQTHRNLSPILRAYQRLSSLTPNATSSHTSRNTTSSST
jgi:hypothetical protein